MLERIMLSFGLTLWAIFFTGLWCALPEPAMAANPFAVSPEVHKGLSMAATWLFGGMFGWAAGRACRPLVGNLCSGCGECQLVPRRLAPPDWRSVAIVAVITVVILAVLVITAKASPAMAATQASMPLLLVPPADIAERSLWFLITLIALVVMLACLSAGYLIGWYMHAPRRMRLTDALQAAADDDAPTSTEQGMRDIAAGLRRHDQRFGA